MVYLLTSNNIPITSIKNYNDNFILSLLHSEVSKVHRSRTEIYQFDIFIQDGMDTDDFDNSEDLINLDIHEHPDITSSLDQIAEMLVKAESRQEARDEDLREEITIAVACQYDWNQQIVKYLNNALSELDSNLIAINIFRELRIPSMDRLTQSLKTALSTEFIYPDDPISFGYALLTALGGML